MCASIAAATPLRRCLDAVRIDLISPCAASSCFSAPQPTSSSSCHADQKVMSVPFRPSRSSAWMLSGGDSCAMPCRCSCSSATTAGWSRPPVRISIANLLRKATLRKAVAPNERGPEHPPRAADGSDRVVHLVLERMRRGAEARDFLHLQRDVAVDEVVGEHAAGLEEVAILVERFQGLVEAVAHGRDVLLFFRRQVVQVLVGRRSEEHTSEL